MVEPTAGHHGVRGGDVLLLAGSLLLSIVMLLSLWLFHVAPNHRIGGVAWNALFQCFNPPFILAYTCWVLAGTLAGKHKRSIGLAAALSPLLVGLCCAARVWPIVMSV